MFDFSQLKQAPFGIQQEFTFYQDFQIADMVGAKKDIEDTYRRAKQWVDNPVAWGEVTCALNWRLWDLYQTNEPIAKLYEKLYFEAKELAYARGDKDKEYARKYFKVVD